MGKVQQFDYSESFIEDADSPQLKAVGGRSSPSIHINYVLFEDFKKQLAGYKIENSDVN